MSTGCVVNTITFLLYRILTGTSMGRGAVRRFETVQR
jgi:hypothetical protein